MTLLTRYWKGGLIALVALAMVATGYLLEAEAGLVVAFSVLQAGVVALLVGVRRAVRNHEQRFAARLDGLDRSLRDPLFSVVERISALDKQIAESSTRADRLAAAVDRLEQTSGGTLEALERSQRLMLTRLESTVEELRKSIDRAQRKTNRQLTTSLLWNFRQIEALSALYYEARPNRAFPPTRSWAASPDLLRYLFQTTDTSGVRSILECGSGVTTIVLAYALRSQGSGRVVSLEHLEQYADLTRAALRDHELEDWAEVRLAPLEPVELDGRTWPWYDLGAVPQGPFDLVLVDGPPGDTGSYARFPAMPLLYDRMAMGGIVVLDDCTRADEREIADIWGERYPSLARETLRHEKGTVVFRRKA